MTFFLLEEIEKHLQAAFSGYLGLSPVDNLLVPAHFSLGFLPPKRSERGQPVDTQGQDFPFVVIRPMAAEDNAQDAAARPEEQVRIICGAYVDPKTMTIRDGVLEIVRMVTKTRQALLSIPNYVLADRYELQLPVKTAFGIDSDGNQPHPYYYGEITTGWYTPPVTKQLTPEEEVRIYGSGYPAT